MKLIVFVGFAMVVWILGYYLDLIPVPKPLIYQYITLTLIAVAQPISIYLTIKSNYETSNHLEEHLEIKITENDINVRGDSFNLELKWKKIYKVDEEKKYFLIYQNNFMAIIISKNDLTNIEIQELKSIFKSIPNVPIHLREKN